MKFCSLFTCLAGLVAFSAAKKHPPMKDLDLDTKITFGWCRQHGVKDSCEERALEHARCYDFEALDDYLNDNLETVSVRGGRCVIWEKNGCHGDHTGMIFGTDLWANNLCPDYAWKDRSSSVKCCGGDPSALWCADPGEVPRCTT